MEVFLLVPGGEVCDAAVAGERSVHHLIEVRFGNLSGFGRLLGGETPAKNNLKEMGTNP